jgi:hypothetical protein
MALAPASTASRGEIALQPSYFTSSLYVETLREDIGDLIKIFLGRFRPLFDLRPFALFQEIWLEEGWSWLHLKALESRARDIFLQVTLRLFLERLHENEPAASRVLALWATYTFYITQPSISSPSIYSIKHIPISIG